MAELQDVVVNAISLVKAGANGEPIQIYKSAEPHAEPEAEAPGTDGQEEVATGVEVVEGQVELEEVIEKGTAKALKALFAPLFKAFGGGTAEVVDKAADIDTTVDYASFKSRMTDPESCIEDALYALRWAIESIFYDDRIKNGRERIIENINDFRDYVSGVLERDRDVQMQFFQKGAEEDVKKEDIIAVVTEAVGPMAKSLETLTTKVETLEKAEATPETDPTEVTPEEGAAEVETPAEGAEEVQKSASGGEPDIAEIVKSAISEAVTPIAKGFEGLSERIDTLESMRGISKGAQVTEVQKGEGSVDEWPEINLGI